MYSYPYLIASNYLLRNLKINSTEINSDIIKVNFSYIEFKKSLDAELTLPDAQDGIDEALKFFEASLLYKLSWLFLEESYPHELTTLLDCVSLYILHTRLERIWVQCCYIKSGESHAYIDRKKHLWNLREVPSYETLLASRYIKEGYLLERLESGYRVKAPSGIERYTTLDSCDCNTKGKLCIHISLVRQVHKHRSNQLVKDYLKLGKK